MTDAIKIALPSLAVVLAGSTLLALFATSCRAPVPVAVDSRPQVTLSPVQSNVPRSNEVRLPPLDAAAPNETDTATFALG